MTASLPELEAEVQRRRDPEVLAVYADALHAAGDPRGELIAIDLELGRLRVAAKARADRRTDLVRFDALVERKRELLTAWVGDTVGQLPWHPRNFEFGVFRGAKVAAIPASSATGYLTSILDSPIGDRIGEISLYGSPAALDDMLDLVIARPLRWLRKLSIYRFDAKGTGGTKPIDKKRWAAVVAATPNVDDLTLIGLGVVATVHPTVLTLRLPGGTGLAVSAPLREITTLDLGLFPPHLREPLVLETCIALAGLVNPRTFPGLRHLDLATNENELFVAALPPTPWVQPALLGPMIDAIEDLGRLESLRLPSLGDTAQRDYVIALADRIPATRIEIARSWVALDGDPRIQIPATRTWPSAARSRDALSVRVPNQPHAEALAVSSLIDDLDGQFDDMLIEAQEAWLAFWKFLEDLPWEDEAGNEGLWKPFPAATLLRALDALDGNHRADLVATLIRNAALQPGADVSIERYWGW